ncbi:MAG: hypothetical protein ACXWL2_04350 [Candidatus Chromulinivorax sp.]
MNKNYNKKIFAFTLTLFCSLSLLSSNPILQKIPKNIFNHFKRSFLSITTPEIAQYPEYQKIEAIIKNNDNLNTKEFLLLLEQAGGKLLEKIEKDKIWLFHNSTYQKPNLIDSLNFSIDHKINSSNLQKLNELRIMKKNYDTDVVLKNFEQLNNKYQSQIIINSEDLFRWHVSRTQKDICGITKAYELIKNTRKELI